MDFSKLVVATLSMLFLSACGKQTAAVTDLNGLELGCASAVVPKQFVVKRHDGSMQVIHANSDEEFVKGYLKEHGHELKYAEHDFYVKALPVEAQDVEAPPPAVTFADNWGAIKISAGAAWSQGIRGNGIIVAVIDTGVDVNHPQLINQIYRNLGEFGADSAGHQKQNNGIDDDANGYIDDYTGFNFVNNTGLTGDNQFHGTHVAGIIAAAHNDSAGASHNYVQGMAPQVKILPLAFLDAEGSGIMSDSVRAIEYAVDAGARVINASWGGPLCSQSLKDEVASLAARDVIFVAAAGNDSKNVDVSPSYPASLNLFAQITVGATGSHDYMAEYSNYGLANVHIFAPGTYITSTIPGAKMGQLSGTSMATPFVAGAVALLLSAVPDASIADVRNALYNSAMHNPEYVNSSHGRMDLGQAVNQLHQIVGH